MTVLLTLLLLAAPARALTVATWNIHKGAGWEKMERELAGPLKDADILLLQEVLTKGEGLQGQKIAVLHGGRAVVAGRDVIVSRLPLAATGYVIVNPQTGRQAAWAEVRTAAGMLRVYSAHLSYKVGRSPFIPEVRDAEMARILAHAEDFAGPVLVGGDFNTVGWFVCCSQDEPLLARLRGAGFSDVTAAAPGRTHHLAGRTDWIFAKRLAPRAARRGPYAGSDHRWLRATLALPAAGAQQSGREGAKEKVK